MKQIFLIMMVLILFSCVKSHRTINIYIDGSQAFDCDKIHVKVTLNNQKILDTIVENKHVANSDFLRTFTHSYLDDNKFLIEVNEKEKYIEVSKDLQCIDMFIRYDDHSLAYKKASEIENKQMEKNISVDFKYLVDSLKNSIIDYSLIDVNLKKVSCDK